jgi:hypothetical protein
MMAFAQFPQQATKAVEIWVLGNALQSVSVPFSVDGNSTIVRRYKDRGITRVVWEISR